MIENVPKDLIYRRGLVAGVLVCKVVLFALGLHCRPFSSVWCGILLQCIFWWGLYGDLREKYVSGFVGW